VGKIPEEVFLPKVPTVEVPATVGQLLEPHTFKTCKPRPLDQLVGAWTVKVLVTSEPAREVQIRKDANIFEILVTAFADEELQAEDRIKVVVKPLKMQDGAVFRCERVKTIARLNLVILLWDRSMARCGIVVSPNAIISEIWREAQKHVEEALEDPKCYGMYHSGYQAMSPWDHPNNELRPEMELRDSVVAKAEVAK
jgi:hypothetical protein